ncbi:MAG TPA: hypothetical protein VF523_16230, partial [Burkholderiales bacterium]
VRYRIAGILRGRLAKTDLERIAPVELRDVAIEVQRDQAVRRDVRADESSLQPEKKPAEAGFVRFLDDF